MLILNMEDVYQVKKSYEIMPSQESEKNSRATSLRGCATKIIISVLTIGTGSWFLLSYQEETFSTPFQFMNSYHLSGNTVATIALAIVGGGGTMLLGCVDRILGMLTTFLRVVSLIAQRKEQKEREYLNKLESYRWDLLGDGYYEALGGAMSLDMLAREQFRKGYKERVKIIDQVFCKFLVSSRDFFKPSYDNSNRTSSVKSGILNGITNENSIYSYLRTEVLDLGGADLRSINLSKLSLKNTLLREVNLSGAYLTKSKLMGADLRGAFFVESHSNTSNVATAKLEGTDLTGANLIRACLTGVNFRGFKITGEQILSETKLNYAFIDKGVVDVATKNTPIIESKVKFDVSASSINSHDFIFYIEGKKVGGAGSLVAHLEGLLEKAKENNSTEEISDITYALTNLKRWMDDSS